MSQTDDSDYDSNYESDSVENTSDEINEQCDCCAKSWTEIPNAFGICHCWCEKCDDELKKRKWYHKNHYEKWQKGLFAYITSFELFKAGEVEIVLIESCPCASKDELFARERFWIENTVCVNKNIPGRTKAEYNEEHRDAISEQKKEYYEQNRDAILERMKEYYEKNKEKVKCEICKSEVRRDGLPQHRKTKKCVSVKSQPKIDEGIA